MSEHDYTRAFRLDGRRALVVGAGSGIGRASAWALAAHGATVLCADRDGDGWRTGAGKIDGPVAAVGLTADASGPATLRVRPEDLVVLPDGDRAPSISASPSSKARCPAAR